MTQRAAREKFFFYDTIADTFDAVQNDYNLNRRIDIIFGQLLSVEELEGRWMSAAELAGLAGGLKRRGRMWLRWTLGSTCLTMCERNVTLLSLLRMPARCASRMRPLTSSLPLSVSSIL
jgi:hypothetical protein